ncbi:Uncharacterised protein [Acinetobacter baumannii]|nr:Uncharacterised protein [Acinetobacter baumannii]
MNSIRREMLCVMHTLKHMDVFVLNFMYLKIYQLNLQKVFLFQIKTMKHGFVFRMLLMMLLEQILKKTHVEWQ